MTTDLRFFLSHVQVDLECAEKPVLRALEAVWGGANQPFIETLKHVRIFVDVANGRVFCDDELIPPGGEERSMLTQVEYVIYELLHQWHEVYTLVHGALLRRSKDTLLLVGPSGSGKSSLALAAMRQGWTYLGDEIAVTNGAEIWGIRRAIQFDSMPTTSKLPPFLQGLDTMTYQWQEPDAETSGKKWCLPLLPVPRDFSATAAPLAGATVVFLNSDHAEHPRRLNGIDALVRLHEACFDHPRHDLGALAGRAWTMGWERPASGVEQLCRLCDAD